jgi:hypothetical protein
MVSAAQDTPVISLVLLPTSDVVATDHVGSAADAGPVETPLNVSDDSRITSAIHGARRAR